MYKIFLLLSVLFLASCQKETPVETPDFVKISTKKFYSPGMKGTTINAELVGEVTNVRWLFVMTDIKTGESRTYSIRRKQVSFIYHQDQYSVETIVCYLDSKGVEICK